MGPRLTTSKYAVIYFSTVSERWQIAGWSSLHDHCERYIAWIPGILQRAMIVDADAAEPMVALLNG